MKAIKIGIFSFMLGAASCSDKPPEALAWEQEMQVDSIFRAEVLLIRPALDSLCEMHFDSLVSHYKDSLWTRRIEEVQRQLQRIQLK
jgi:hypothetical protein